jgi:transposase
MVLGASRYTFDEAAEMQSAANVIDSAVHGFEYFGCVPEIMVPDQLRGRRPACRLTGRFRGNPSVRQRMDARG